jgi:hypothetical protein
MIVFSNDFYYALFEFSTLRFMSRGLKIVGLYNLYLLARGYLAVVALFKCFFGEEFFIDLLFEFSWIILRFYRLTWSNGDVLEITRYLDM